MTMYKTVQRIVFGLCAIGVAGILTGCATMSTQSQCLSADWYSIGLEDGANGLAKTGLKNHRPQCDEIGVPADMQAYEQGRVEGLDYFCTVSNGLTVGKVGRSYAGTCPSNLEYYFLTGYRLGREMHRVDDDMHANRNAVSEAEQQLQSKEIAEARAAEIRYQIRLLDREFVRMQSRLQYLELEQQRIVVADSRSANLASGD